MERINWGGRGNAPVSRPEAEYRGHSVFRPSFPDKISIYIEKVYNVDVNGAFLGCVKNTRGMLLREEDFEYLEFF